MKIKLLNDVELFDLIKAKDNSAFEELYNKYWEELYNAAYRRLADEFFAEEIVQETFVNLFLKKDTLVITTTLKAYMHTVLKYKVIDEIRKRIVQQSYLKGLSNLPIKEYNDVHRLFEKKELREYFHFFANTLPTRCKAVFVLKQAEFSNKEIAEQLNISQKTVEGHVSHARKLMRIFFNSIYKNTLFLLFIKMLF